MELECLNEYNEYNGIWCVNTYKRIPDKVNKKCNGNDVRYINGEYNIYTSVLLIREIEEVELGV